MVWKNTVDYEKCKKALIDMKFSAQTDYQKGCFWKGIANSDYISSTAKFAGVIAWGAGFPGWGHCLRGHCLRGHCLRGHCLGGQRVQRVGKQAALLHERWIGGNWPEHRAQLAIFRADRACCRTWSHQFAAGFGSGLASWGTGAAPGTGAWGPSSCCARAWEPRSCCMWAW